MTDPTGSDEGTAGAAGAGDDKSRRHSNFVQSLDRGLAVLRAFGPEHSELTLSASPGPPASRGRPPAASSSPWSSSAT